MLCCFDGGFRKQVGFKIFKAVFQFATVRRFAHFNKKKPCCPSLNLNLLVPIN